MSYVIDVERAIATTEQSIESQTLADQPSSLEIFSYGFCCMMQGLVGIGYLVLVSLVPLAIQQGMF